MNRLSGKQEAFASLIADGETGSNAYRQSYHSAGKTTVVAVEATRLASKPKVAARIVALRQKSTDARCATRIEKRLILARIMCDKSIPIAARIAAIQVDNRMAGHDQPELSAMDDPLAELLAKIRRTVAKP